MKCKCGNEFEPIYRNGILVSKMCINCVLAKVRTKKAKERKISDKQTKEKLKTKSDWLRELQTHVNRYIRFRDKDKPCISCGRSLTDKFDAGHYFTVGAYPNLRFNEDNIWGQCVACNQHKHGNISEYTPRLIERIGQERFDKLCEDRNKPLHLSVEEIKELIAIYKAKIKSTS